MNKIEKLIQQYCPEGVEWKELGEIGTIYGGLTGKSKSDFEKGNSFFLSYMDVYSNISINELPKNKVEIGEGERQNKVKYGDIIFTGSSETANECGMSSVVTSNFETEVYLNSFCFGYRFNQRDLINPEFAKYLFRVQFVRYQINKTASGVTRFNISKERFKKISIPIPPLPIQEEIVNILDKFTRLEAELEAELEFRKKQYEFYRNQLLSPEKVGNQWMLNGVEVEWKTLGDCIETNKGGGTPSKANVNYWEGGNIPWASVGDLSGDGIFVKSTRSYITQEGLDNSSTNLIPKENIIVAVKITPGLMKINKIDIAINQDIRGLVLKKFMNPKFLCFYFKIIDISGHGSIVKSITSSQLERIKIPIPPLSEQERIVAILDEFDTLVNDISMGIPAEQSARKKQYEYYREKLLSF